MTDLVILLAQRLGYPPEKSGQILHHERINRIVTHYRKALAKGQMRLGEAVDRAYGDICGQNRSPDRQQRNEPIWR